MVSTAAKAKGFGAFTMAAAACLLAAASAAVAGQAESASAVADAERSYRANLALGDMLRGKAATADQVAEAQLRIEHGLQAARSAPATESRSAAAHHIIGLLLSSAYRPVQTKLITNQGQAGGVTSTTATVLKRGNSNQKERQEGLAELKTAVRLEPENAGYQLDYAEALQFSGQAKQSVEQLGALWDRRGDLPIPQRSRTVHLLANGARLMNRPTDEMRWLREAVKMDPKDTEAARRLGDLTPKSSSITWMGFDDGMAAARQAKKPVMMDFSTSWCGWCRKLESEVFSKPEVIDLSGEFVCVRVDGDQRKDLVRRYGVEGFPTIVFLNQAGQPAHRVVGYEEAGRFLSDMKTALGK
jgi:thiol-disulfide isomerase/thioredoxin